MAEVEQHRKRNRVAVLAVLAVVAVAFFAPVTEARRRSMRSPGLAPLDFRAAISVQVLEDGRFLTYGHLLSGLPIHTKVERRLIQPDGRIHLPFSGSGVLPVYRENWLVPMWEGRLPEAWSGKNPTLEIIVTTPDGKKFTVSAEMPNGGNSHKAEFLGRAVVDGSGGIMLVDGTFSTPLTVVSNNQLVPIVDGFYIPAGSIGGGRKVLTWSAGIHGNPHDLFSTSQVVDLPD